MLVLDWYFASILQVYYVDHRTVVNTLFILEMKNVCHDYECWTQTQESHWMKSQKVVYLHKCHKVTKEGPNSSSHSLWLTTIRTLIQSKLALTHAHALGIHGEGK